MWSEEGGSTYSARILSRLLAFLAVVLAGAAIATIIIYDQAAESWPKIAQYLVSNPILATIVGAVIVFVTIDRFREMSLRIGALDRTVVEISQNVNQALDDNYKKAEDTLSARFERIEGALQDVESRYPWLKALGEQDFVVNVPTLSAILQNLKLHIENRDMHLAYELLYEAANGDFEGDLRLYEELAIIAFVIYDDAHTSDVLLRKAQDNSRVMRAVWMAKRLFLATVSGRLALGEQLSRQIESLRKKSWYSSIISIFTSSPVSQNWADSEDVILYLRIFYEIHPDKLRYKKANKRISNKLKNIDINKEKFADSVIDFAVLGDTKALSSIESSKIRSIFEFGPLIGRLHAFKIERKLEEILNVARFGETRRAGLEAVSISFSRFQEAEEPGMIQEDFQGEVTDQVDGRGQSKEQLTLPDEDLFPEPEPEPEPDNEIESGEKSSSLEDAIKKVRERSKDSGD